MRHKSLWWHLFIAIGLFVPVVAFYAAHFTHEPDGKHATGFIQYDIPYYMANARQYIDGQSQGLFYSNPYDERSTAPAIYFQPQIAALSIPLRWTPDHPEVPFLMLGAASAILAFFLISLLVERFCPGLDRSSHAIVTIIACWGGGSLAIMGLAFQVLRDSGQNILRFDPEFGWWLINFGRNFLIPTEAFYHMLAAAIWVAVAFGHTRAAIAIAFFLAMAHPFTGVQYGVILCAWFVLEQILVKAEGLKVRDVLFRLSVPAYSFGYYLFYLSRFPAHRELMEQWTIFEWFLAPISMAGGFLSVAALALYRCRSRDRFLECFADPANRLLGVSFLVSLALSKHELFIKPHQPIHFTRGHIWMPLCLLGLPVIASIVDRLRTNGKIGTIGILAVAVFFLSDNLTFLISNALKPTGIYMAEPVQATLARLDESGDHSVLVSDEYDAVGYLSAVYTGVRPYMGHYANTLHAARKKAEIERFFKDGSIPEELAGERILIVTRRYRERMNSDSRFESVFQWGDYCTYRMIEINPVGGPVSPVRPPRSNHQPEKS
jgi:hypothetical protein